MVFRVLVKVEDAIVMAFHCQIWRSFKEKEMEKWKRKRKGEDEYIYI